MSEETVDDGAKVEDSVQNQKVTVGPVEVTVTVVIPSPDPGGAGDAHTTKSGLGPRKKVRGLRAGS